MKKREKNSNGRNGDRKSLKKPVEVVYDTCREHNRKPHNKCLNQECQLMNSGHCERFEAIFEEACTDSHVDTAEKRDGLLKAVIASKILEPEKGIVKLKTGFKNVLREELSEEV